MGNNLKTKSKEEYILIVDDEKEVRDLEKASLKDLGLEYKIKECKDGKEALEYITNHPNMKLLITDNNMPKMTGIELVSKIYPQYQGKIIMISSYVDNDLEKKLNDSIPNNNIIIIKKPFNIEDYTSAVEQVLSKYNK